jgi:hypothetical protein
VAGRAIPVIFTSDEVVAVMILQLLLQWKIVELSSQSKLPVNFFLADVEVLHIEEA